MGAVFSDIVKPEAKQRSLIFGNCYELLLHGYIRTQQFNLKIEIANDISILILKYFISNSNVMYFLAPIFGGDNNIHSIDLRTQERSKTQVTYDWNKKDNRVNDSETLCYQNNIRAYDSTLASYSYFNAIFRFGYHVLYSDDNERLIQYYSGRCNALMWKMNDNVLKKGINVELPTNPLFDEHFYSNYRKRCAQGQSIVYSNKQQSLFLVGCSNIYMMNNKPATFFKLDFSKYVVDDTKDNYKDYIDDIHVNWKWCKMKKQMHKGRTRGCMTCAIVNNKYDHEQLICVAGSGVWNKCSFVDIYDFETSKWINLNDLSSGSRYQCGIYYHTMKDYLYVGGGSGATDTKNYVIPTEKRVEYCDVTKNKWFYNTDSIPDTSKMHTYHPVLWVEDNNLLFISSLCSNAMEFVDLRKKNRAWTVMYEKLNPLFRYSIHKDTHNCARLFIDNSAIF